MKGWYIKEDSLTESEHPLGEEFNTWFVEIVKNNDRGTTDTICIVEGETAVEAMERAKLIADAPQMKERIISLQSND